MPVWKTEEDEDYEDWHNETGRYYKMFNDPDAEIEDDLDDISEDIDE